MSYMKQTELKHTVINFREDRAILERAKKQAAEEGTQLASVLRRLLRGWLKADAGRKRS